MSKESKSEIIHTTGVWLLRFVLIGAAIYFYATGKEDAANGCLVAFLLALFFL